MQLATVPVLAAEVEGVEHLLPEVGNARAELRAFGQMADRGERGDSTEPHDVEEARADPA